MAKQAPAAASAGGGSVRRTALWVLLAIVLVIGLVLYFRYEAYVTPMVDPSVRPASGVTG